MRKELIFLMFLIVSISLVQATSPTQPILNFPLNESIDISINPVLNITFTDPDGENLTNVTFWDKMNYLDNGYAYTCGILSNGSIQCWGLNGNGQLGVGDTTQRNNPTSILSTNTFVSLSGGNGHTCAILINGSVMCWGYNSNGQLGVGNTSDVYTPVPIISDDSFALISAGFSYTCGILSNGSIQCWGINNYGQLGVGNTSDVYTPVPIISTNTFVSLTTGKYHACGILSNGSIQCWGNNFYGSLGVGNTSDVYTPVPIISDDSFVAVSGGNAHTCGLLTNGSIQCWGINDYGQLGVGNTSDVYTPVPIISDDSFVAVSAGGAHTCGLLTNGSIQCWGQNTYGQLGTGDDVECDSPAYVNSSDTFVSISTGTAYTCGLLTNGSIMCWGVNGNGQLGVGDTTWYNTSIAVNSSDTFKSPLIEKIINATTGNEVTTVFAGLNYYLTYFWGVTLDNGLGIVNSPLWRFRTLTAAEPDSILPSASIFSPLNASYLSDTPDIIAIAADNVQVDYVFFQYKNDTDEWSNFSGCENVPYPAMPFINFYNCSFNASEFSETANYSIRAIPVDTSGNTNWWTTPFNYYIDVNRPYVYFPTVTYPESQTIARNGQNITLTVNVTDSPYVASGISFVAVDLTDLNGSGITNMVLIEGDIIAGEISVWQLNITLDTLNTYDPYTTPPFFRPKIYAYDNATPVYNLRDSEVFQVYIDNTAPILSESYSPLNPNNGTTVTFSASSSDNYNVSEMILFYNFNDTLLNETFATSGVLVSNSFNYEMLNGTWSYYWMITDEAGNSYTESEQIVYVGFAEENLTINLNDPEDGYVQLSGLQVNFTYNVSGDTAPAYCDLYANDNLWNRQFGPVKDTNISFEVTFSEFGYYEWYVNCTDTLLKTYSSGLWNFTLTDDINPVITILNPLANEDFNNFVEFISLIGNFSVEETNLESCWYSLNGAENISVSCSESIYNNFAFSLNYSGSILLEVYANDTTGGEGYANRTFSITPYTGPRTGLSGGGNMGQYYVLNSGFICNQTYLAILENKGNLSFTDMEISELSTELTTISNSPITSDVLKEYLYNFKDKCTDYSLQEPFQDVTPTIWKQIVAFIKWLAYLIYPYNYYIGMSLLLLIVLLIVFHRKIIRQFKSVKSKGYEI